eukprot:s2320_g16.t1
MDLHFVWQAWRLWHSARSCDALGPVDAASLCVAGVALGDMDLHFVWQAWQLETSTFTLCGIRGTYGIQLAPVMRLGPVDAASLCVAGAALGDIDLHFVWQAWHLVTWTFTLCGRRGTYGTQLAPVTPLGPVDAASLCVAGVALGDMDLHFVWQVWHLWHSAGSCDALGLPFTPRHFVWQAWRLVTCTFTLCGRRGTHGTGLAQWRREDLAVPGSLPDFGQQTVPRSELMIRRWRVPPAAKGWEATVYNEGTNLVLTKLRGLRLGV